MTTDAKIVADLAIVGRTSRTRPVPLEATLRAVAGGTVGPSRASPSIDAALVAMSRIYSLRVARIAAAVAAITFVVARLIYALIPELANDGLVSDLLWIYPESLPRMLGGIAIVYLFAANIASGAFRRDVGAATEPRARARVLVASVDRWSIAMAIAGTSTIAIADLAARFLFHGPLLWLQPEGTPDWTERDALLHAIPVVAPILASWICARLIARRRVTRVPLWIAGIAFPLVVGGVAWVDEGSYAAPAIFATSMTLVVAVIAALVVHRRDRELAAIDPKEAP